MAATRLRLLVVPAVVLCFAGCGGGRPPTPATSTTQHTEAAARSQRVLNDTIEAHVPGCAAAVGIEGHVEWSGARGLADMAAGTPITDRTVFDIASVSKQFTATAALLLVGDDKLTLDQPVSRHLPELPPWAATITVGQLMHQTSGIPDYVGLLEGQGFGTGDRTTEEQALQAVAGIPQLEFEPGSQFEYSNSNYLLLGEIVHRVTAEPLPQVLADQIFRPLGLDMVLDPTRPLPQKAVAYEKDDQNYRASSSGWEQVGDGGIQTTPSQLVVWGDNYRTGRVGGSELLDAQLAGAVPTGHDRYGAGIYLMADGSLDHDGIWAGFVTAFRVSKDRTTTIAVSCNTDKQDPEALAASLGRIWM